MGTTSQLTLFPRLTQYLLENDATRLELQVVFDDLRGARPADECTVGGGVPDSRNRQTFTAEFLSNAEGEEDDEDIRFWLWRLDLLPAELSLDRAVMLLRHAGILKSG